ncbi:nuclear transport factor 2 family protein [Lysinimonas soli]|uniref:Nuclear transport factor 2 family protein n=1 Tax=Lysinimonas soli TaxID=1074233 RepID=A0ABW0NUH3_9MICO
MTEQHLERLVPRIYAMIDDHLFDELRDFYSAEIVGETPGGALRGRDELVAQLRRNHESVPALQHLVTGVLVDQRRDDAELRANLVAIFAADDGAVSFELGSVWRGTARRDSDGWRITRFAISPVWRRGTRPRP